MMQYLLDVLSAMGIIGLMISMAIEGSSVPFPGILIILTYGYLLEPSLPEMSGLALGMSVSYGAASLIPYEIGRRLGGMISKRFSRKAEKALWWIDRYGAYSIALLRPFAAGNYISYAAGMSRIKPLKYLMLTLLGIYPWCFIMLFLGKTYKGSIGAVMGVMKPFKAYIYASIALLIICGIIVYKLLNSRVKIKR
jgi:membrane protein DedA with SNARE-associated domain